MELEFERGPEAKYCEDAAQLSLEYIYTENKRGISWAIEGQIVAEEVGVGAREQG